MVVVDVVVEFFGDGQINYQVNSPLLGVASRCRIDNINYRRPHPLNTARTQPANRGAAWPGGGLGYGCAGRPAPAQLSAAACTYTMPMMQVVQVVQVMPCRLIPMLESGDGSTCTFGAIVAGEHVKRK